MSQAQSQLGLATARARRALQDGPRVTSNVPDDFPGSDVAAAIGLQTYVSVPVIDPMQTVVGTLCGASDRQVDLDSSLLPIMEMFARLIGDQWERDRLQTQLHERAERAERQLRDRATLLARAEHGLKSPLTVVKGWASTLDDHWDDFSEEDKRKAVQVILRSSDQLAAQIHDLLAEARNEVLTTSLDLRPRNLVPVLQRAVDELGGVSAAHPVFLDTPGPLFAVADETAFWQVLVHLVENAIKYSPNGGAIECRGWADAGAVHLTVRDHGLGIPNDVDIFEPFVRSGRRDLAAIDGTGLGLHIVITLVTSMNGTITAEALAADLGGGSIFTVTLPARP